MVNTFVCLNIQFVENEILLILKKICNIFEQNKLF